MDAKTLEALKASIAKWEMNVETARASLKDNSRISIGVHAKKGVIGMLADGCALCDLFNDAYSHLCDGCPVEASSGQPFCRDTPYQGLAEITPEMGEFFTASQEVVAACEAEVAFLRSLLPAEG